MRFYVSLEGGEVGFVFLFGEDVVRRVADDGVESGIGQAVLAVEENVREFDFPMERRVGGAFAEGLGSGCGGVGIADWEKCFGCFDGVDECGVVSRRGLGIWRKEKSGDPNVGDEAKGFTERFNDSEK